MISAYIGIGSNIDRKKHIASAIQALKKLDANLRLSTIYECEAVGFDSEPFYNCVANLKVNCELNDLADQLRQIELELGRPLDAKKHQPRTIDLDILLFGDVQCQVPVKLPRKDIFEFAFVLEPLSELSPDLIVPGDGRRVSELKRQQDLNYHSLKAVPNWFI